MITRMSSAFATEPAVIAQQAEMVATAWSPPGSPPSWQLTAAQFATLGDDAEMLAIAATIPTDRLPPLLFAAAATFLVLELEPRPLAPAIADGREIALVDIGTGAGLALHLDRYRYVFRGAGGQATTVGDPRSPVLIETEVRSMPAPPIAATLPRIADRTGVDIEPLDLGDAGVRAWLAACIPQEIGAVTRFHDAVEVAIDNPVRAVRGDACAVLPDVLSAIPDELLVCLLDTYVHVFFDADKLHEFRALVDTAGAERDLDWVSIDPLVPMGMSATRSVLGIPVPDALIERNHREGVFCVIGRLSYRRGERSAALLGAAHPGAAWLEWFAP